MDLPGKWDAAKSSLRSCFLYMAWKIHNVLLLTHDSHDETKLSMKLLPKPLPSSCRFTSSVLQVRMFSPSVSGIARHESSATQSCSAAGPQALPEEFPDLGDVVRFLHLCHLFLLQLNQRGAGGACRIARIWVQVLDMYVYIYIYSYKCVCVYIYTIYIDLSPTSWLFDWEKYAFLKHQVWG